VVLTGRLGRDLDLRTLPGGSVAATSSLAVETGRDKTAWFNVVMYSPVAEQVAQRAGKGAQIVVHGRLIMVGEGMGRRGCGLHAF